MAWYFNQDSGNSPSSPELEEASWEGNCSDGIPSALSSMLPIPEACFSQGNGTDTCHHSLSGTMCRRSTGDHGAEALISLRADSHAKTYPLPEGVKESPESGADFGFTWPGSSAKYDPDTRSWKTRQCSLLGDLEPYSGTFPRWGMMRSGELLELPTPVIATAGTGSGSSGNWPTPRADEPGRTSVGYGRGLAELVEGRDQKGGNWPTPTCADQYTDKLKSSQQKDGSMHSVNLSQAVGMNLSTPVASDYNSRKASDNWQGSDLSSQVAPPKQVGVLNPEWEELLMCWPIGWTNLEPLPILNWPFRDRGAFVSKRGLPQHEWEPPRTCGKIPNRNARVKAIGNGQDPSALVLAVRMLSEIISKRV